MYFAGQYTLQLDDKDRFRIPAKLKEKIGAQIFISVGSATKDNLNCLVMYTKEKAESLQARDTRDMTDDEVEAKNIFYRHGDEPEEDSQNRYKLALHLKEWAGITKNLVFTGAGGHVEVWAEEVWNKHKKESAMTTEEVAALLKKLRL